MNKLLAAKLWVCAACRANGSCALRIFRTPGMKSDIVQRAFVHAVDKQSGEEFVDVHAKFCISHSKISPRYATDEMPNTVSALSLQLDGLYWLTMSKDRTVVDWDMQPLLENRRQRLNFHEMFRLVATSVDLVRPSDVYLLEEKAGGASSIKSLSAVPRALVSARLETTLLTILQCRGQLSVQDEQTQPAVATTTAASASNVFKLKSSAIGSLFNISVGGERTSCSKVVHQICSRQLRDNPASDVGIPEEFAAKFRNCDAAKQEQLGSCLLQALTFYYLLGESNTIAYFS